jgi:hypothetical protein
MDETIDLKDKLGSYYRLVDAADYPAMLELFHPQIVYERFGHPTIVGAEALRAFYLNDRQIDGGTHTIDVIVADGEWAVAKGSFAGTLKNGSEVEVGFADFHRFSSGLIRWRYTFFAGRPV